MRSWRLSQPAYGMLAEQRKQLSRWAMSAGKGPALLELGKLTPPELVAGGDSPEYSARGDSSPDYSSRREAVSAPADSSPPPLVTPERSGAWKEEAGPRLSGRWWDRPRDTSAKFGTAVGPEAVRSGKMMTWGDPDTTDTASEAGTEGVKTGGEHWKL